ETWPGESRPESARFQPYRAKYNANTKSSRCNAPVRSHRIWRHPCQSAPADRNGREMGVDRTLIGMLPAYAGLPQRVHQLAWKCPAMKYRDPVESDLAAT